MSEQDVFKICVMPDDTWIVHFNSVHFLVMNFLVCFNIAYLINNKDLNTYK